jgi:hypothetical protein
VSRHRGACFGDHCVRRDGAVPKGIHCTVHRGRHGTPPMARDGLGDCWNQRTVTSDSEAGHIDQLQATSSSSACAHGYVVSRGQRPIDSSASRHRWHRCLVLAAWCTVAPGALPRRRRQGLISSSGPGGDRLQVLAQGIPSQTRARVLRRRARRKPPAPVPKIAPRHRYPLRGRPVRIPDSSEATGRRSRSAARHSE